MKIKFNKIKATEENLTLFNGEDNVIINKERAEIAKTDQGAIPIDNWCKDLSKIYVLDDREYYPEYTEGQNDKLANSKYIEVLSKPFAELQSYDFDSTKLYRIHINEENMTHNTEVKNNELASFIRLHNNIIEIIVDSDVTAIKSFTFAECTSLSRIKLPESIVTIGSYAFYGCSGLVNINIPDSVMTISEYTFNGCSALEEIILPKYLTNIGSNAFSDCAKLKSINKLDALVSLGQSAFQNCTELRKVEVGNSIINIDDAAFMGCTSLENISLPNSLSIIGNGAFQGCSILLSATLGDDIDVLGDKAFAECNKLKSIRYGNTLSHWANLVPSDSSIGISYDKVTIYCTDGEIPEFILLEPTTLSNLENYNFIENKHYGLSITSFNLKEIERLRNIISSHPNIIEIHLVDDVKAIPDEAFMGLNNISRLYLSASLESIGNDAFRNCNNIEDIKFNPTESNLTNIGDRAFQGCIRIESIVLPNKLTTLGISAFEGCNVLADIDFGNNVKTIGQRTFADCESLVNLVIPNNITTIEDSAFYSCKNLEDVKTGDALDTIKISAFANCTSLKKVTFGTSLSELKVLENDSFSGCSSLKDIEYHNTRANWANVILDITSIGLSYETVAVHCTDGDYQKIVILNSMTNEELGSFHFSVDTYYELHLSAENVTELGLDQDGNPNRVTRVLQNNPKIYKIYLDVSKDLPDNAFINCDNIKELEYPGTSEEWIDLLVKKDIYLPSSTTIYCKEDGINIYTYDKVPETAEKFILSLNNLYEVGKGQELTEFIKTNTASNRMDTVIVGANLKYLAAGTFYDCSNLTRIIIPRTITVIRDNVFTGCTGLTNITYTGTVVNWKEIATNPNANGLDMNTTVIYCSDGIIKNKNINLFAQTPSVLTSYNFKTNDTYELHISKDNIIQSDLITILNNNDSIKVITIDDDVTEIGNNAFLGCKYVNTFNIGKSVTTIGANSFENNLSISSITIPDNVTNIKSAAFKNSKELVEVSTGNGLISISNEAFSNCKRLKTLNIGTAVISIGNKAFSECDSLVNVVLPPNVKSLGEDVFIGCNNLEKIEGLSVTGIGNKAFYNCRKLKEALFTKVETIGIKTFYNCISLGEFNMPSASDIGDNAFQNCISLISINIQGLQNIGKYVFRDCEKLGSVKLSNLLRTLSEGTFSGCDSLYKVIIGNAIDTIGDYAFFGCTNLTNLTMTSTTTTIGKSSFEGCRKLNQINMTTSLGTIGERAFFDCRELESIKVSPAIKIGKDSFRNCFKFKLIESASESSVFPITNAAFTNAGLDIKDITIKCLDKNLPNEETLTNNNIEEIIQFNYEDRTLYTLPIKTEYFSSLGYDEYGKAKPLTEILQKEEVIKISLKNSNGVPLPKDAFKGSNIRIIQYLDVMSEFDKLLDTKMDDVVKHNSLDYVGLSLLNVDVICNDGLLNTPLEISGESVLKDRFNVNRIYNVNTKNLNRELTEKIGDKKNMIGLSVKDGLVEVNQTLFGSCPNLKALDFPNSLVKIGEGTFKEFAALKDIKIPEVNELFVVKDKILYTKPLTILKKVVDVDVLEIHVSNKVKYIENDSMKGCSKLQDIYFDGTREQWDKLGITGSKSAAIGIDYNNVNIICNDYVILQQLSNDSLMRCNFQVNKGFLINLSTENINSLGLEDGGTDYKPLLKSLQDRICIRQVLIHKETLSIPEKAFEGIENLEAIYYEGTKEEWNKLVPKLEYIGAPNVRVICTNGVIKDIELPLMSYEELNAYPFVKGRDYIIHADAKLLE